MTSFGMVQRLFKWMKLLLVLFTLCFITLMILRIRIQITSNNTILIPSHTSSQIPAPYLKTELEDSTKESEILVILKKNHDTSILKYLQHLRFVYETCIVNQDCVATPYSLIIFNEGSYSEMSHRFSASLISQCHSRCTFIVLTSETRIEEKFLSNKLIQPQHITFQTLSNPIYFLTRPNLNYFEKHFSESISCFSSFHPTYKPLLISNLDSEYSNCWTIIQDVGEVDFIPKVYFGISPNYWLANLIFLDILKVLVRNSTFQSFPLERYLMVDIDDVFLGAKGLKLDLKDVDRLLQSQDRIKEVIPGFKYNLGYCGAYFQSGDPAVQRGDQFLIEKASEFAWFGHIWSHTKPHESSEKSLIQLMEKDLAFAVRYNLSLESTHYSVTPHHSGIYPIHLPLYNAWEELGHVSVTSTEQYPFLWPHHQRRGFVYKSISVLPRQVCGLYTKINFFSNYSGGESAFYKSIRGGSVFKTLVYNPVSIFMTHYPNYAGDYLSQTMFEELTQFVHRYTGISLQYKKPVQLAEIYFKLFPDDRLPVWNLPCNTLHNSRHAEIYAGDSSCDRIPRMLIVGPQKTGSTALLSFLTTLPMFASSQRDPDTFEEIQFFSNLTRYLYGPDWYQERFPAPLERTLIEKSATYFDHNLAPKRIRFLLPDSLIAIILHDPIQRAFSWFQHQRAHHNKIALKYSFIEVLRNETDLLDAKERNLVSNLRSRCLEPGKYSLHIRMWLKHFRADNILFIDGVQIVQNPFQVLTDIMNFTKIYSTVNFSNYLQFDSSKGFYCPLDASGDTMCLGPGKGRIYDPLTKEEFDYLKDFYTPYNKQLKTMLLELNRAIPIWI